MLPGPYFAEIKPPFLPLKVGSTDSGVKRVQEWLTLHGFATGIDGDFGPATRDALKAFQTAHGLPVTGEVDLACWEALVAPLVRAEAPLPPSAGTFGQGVLAVAAAWLANKAREVGGDNRGPWVRQCGRGIDQSKVGFFPWCQVYGSHVWIRASRELGLPLPFDLVDGNGVVSAYVPWVVNQARKAGKFMVGAGAGRIAPGSMFFVPGNIDGQLSHIHVGLVVSDDGDVVQTNEGNTNSAGGSNGYEVARRFRRKANLDFGLLS